LGTSGPRVVVVGGGVIGVCTAYFLTRAGAEVTLIERGRIGGEASWGNAGTVSAGHLPLNKPGRVSEGLTRMFDPSSPLHIPPRWDPALWSWLFDFARNCTDEAVSRAMDVMGPMGHRTLQLFARVIAEEGIDCGYRADGYYDVCVTEPGLSAAVAEADAIRPHAYFPEVLDGAELRYREPALAGPLAGGVFHPHAATLDPARFVAGLAEAFRRRGGRTQEGVAVLRVVRDGARATGVECADGREVRADAVVLATGPFDLQLATNLGTRIPVQAGKGYHRDLSVGPNAAPELRIACVLHESSVFCTPLGDRLRLAGTMEFSGIDAALRPERLGQITRAACASFPALRGVPARSDWCGLRPVSADGIPVVGKLPGVEGAWVATGHGMLGLTLAPVTGEYVADAILGRDFDTRLLALSPSRFHR